MQSAERSDIGMELSLLLGIIVACITGPLYDGNFMLYGFGAFGGTYIVVNLIHLWLKSLAKKKIEFISNATRCALNYEMDLSLYFRVVNAINMLVEDDMEFLAENITLFERPEDNHLKQNNHG